MVIGPDAVFTLSDFELIAGFASVIIISMTAIYKHMNTLKSNLENKIIENKKELDLLKLHVAENYAPAAIIEKIEIKLTEEIRRLGDRLDHLFQKPRRSNRIGE